MSPDRPAVASSGPAGPGRRIGILTTDDRLVITSWDGALAAMTGIAGGDAVGRPLTAVVPDLEPRGLLGIVRDALVTGAPTVLAPAFHHYLVPAPPANPSSRYDRMQQRVALAPLVEAGRAVGSGPSPSTGFKAASRSMARSRAAESASRSSPAS